MSAQWKQVFSSANSVVNNSMCFYSCAARFGPQRFCLGQSASSALVMNEMNNWLPQAMLAHCVYKVWSGLNKIDTAFVSKRNTFI